MCSLEMQGKGRCHIRIWDHFYSKIFSSMVSTDSGCNSQCWNSGSISFHSEPCARDAYLLWTSTSMSAKWESNSLTHSACIIVKRDYSYLIIIFNSFLCLRLWGFLTIGEKYKNWEKKWKDKAIYLFAVQQWGICCKSVITHADCRLLVNNPRPLTPKDVPRLRIMQA